MMAPAYQRNNASALPSPRFEMLSNGGRRRHRGDARRERDEAAGTRRSRTYRGDIDDDRNRRRQ